MSATLTLGTTYTFGGTSWVCAEVFQNYAVLQNTGISYGLWPGITMSKWGNGLPYRQSIDGQDISEYDNNTIALYNAIKNAEYNSATYGTGLYLVNLSKVNQTTIFSSVSGYYGTALTTAANNANNISETANYKYSWLGIYESDNSQDFYYAVSDSGNLGRWGSYDVNLVIAPAFNVDLSKIKLTGTAISISDSSSGSESSSDSPQQNWEEKCLDQTNTQYLLNKIKNKLNSEFTANEVTTATLSTFGKVKPDGSTILINNDGVISLTSDTVGIATNIQNGLLKPDDNTIFIKSDGTLHLKKEDITPIPIPEPEEENEENEIPPILFLVRDKDNNIYGIEKSSNIANWGVMKQITKENDEYIISNQDSGYGWYTTPYSKNYDDGYVMIKDNYQGGVYSRSRLSGFQGNIPNMFGLGIFKENSDSPVIGSDKFNYETGSWNNILNDFSVDGHISHFEYDAMYFIPDRSAYTGTKPNVKYTNLLIPGLKCVICKNDTIKFYTYSYNSWNSFQVNNNINVSYFNGLRDTLDFSSICFDGAAIIKYENGVHVTNLGTGETRLLNTEVIDDSGDIISRQAIMVHAYDWYWFDNPGEWREYIIGRGSNDRDFSVYQNLTPHITDSITTCQFKKICTLHSDFTGYRYMSDLYFDFVVDNDENVYYCEASNNYNHFKLYVNESSNRENKLIGSCVSL